LCSTDRCYVLSFKPPSLYIPISWGASLPGGRLYTAGRPGRFVLEGTGGRRRRFIFVGRTDRWRWSSTPHCAHLPQPLDRYLSRQPARHVPPAASRTFRTHLLFPGSRRFVYLVQLGAGHRTELLMYVTTGKKGSPYSIAERRVSELIPVFDSRPAGDVSHKPGDRLPLLSLSARPAVTRVTLKRAAINFAAW